LLIVNGVVVWSAKVQKSFELLNTNRVITNR